MSPGRILGWLVAAAILGPTGSVSDARPAAARQNRPPAPTPEVEATLEPSPVGVGEVVRLTISIGGEGFMGRGLGQPTFSLENLVVVGGPSRRENLRIVNGRASRSYQIVWYLEPREPGLARVHDLRVPLGEGLELGDRSVEVTEAPQSPRRSRREARNRSPLENLVDEMLSGRNRPSTDPLPPPEIRLEARVSDPRPWQGEQVTYELDLLVERRRPGEGRVRVDSIFPRQLPEFRGFWSQEIPLPDQARPEVVQAEGRTFWRQPVVKRALFPLREGDRRIEGAALDLRVVHYRPSVFGEEPGRPETTTVESNPVAVAVRSLPPPPAGFSGAVGTGFRLRTTVEPAILELDEAARFTASLEGSGHLGGIADPELPPLEGLTAHPPEEASSRDLAGERVVERRRWRWTLVPSSEGRFTIPPLSWTYFDPREGEYRELRTEPVRLAAAGPSAREPAAPDPGDSPPGSPSGGPADADTPPGTGLGISWRPVAGTMVAVGLLVLLLVRIRRRRSESERTLISRLRTLPEETPRRTASTAEEAWRAYLQEEWGLPPGVPCREWTDHLRRGGADPDTARDLVGLMDDLHYLRYAPQLASSEALGAELLPRSRKILRRL